MHENRTSDLVWADLLQAVYWFDESLQLHHKQAGYPQMSRTKSLVMLSIAQGNERPIHIAERLGLTRQGVHLAIKELEAEGLVSIADDPTDRRAKRVFFSQDDQREEMRRFAVDALHRIEDVLAARVGRKNFAVFRRVLQADWGEAVSPESGDRTASSRPASS